MIETSHFVFIELTIKLCLLIITIELITSKEVALRYHFVHLNLEHSLLLYLVNTLRPADSCVFLGWLETAASSGGLEKPPGFGFGFGFGLGFGFGTPVFLHLYY